MTGPIVPPGFAALPAWPASAMTFTSDFENRGATVVLAPQSAGAGGGGGGASSVYPAASLNLVKRLAAQEAHVPESNSLYEYLAWKVYEAARSKKGESFDRLMLLFARPHSLNDLADFAEWEELLLTPAFTDACLLGDGFARETFEEALSRPEMSGPVRSAFSKIAAGRLPGLMKHRLFHVLLSSDHEYKVSEFLRFSWEQKTTSVQPACVPHPEVKRAIQAVEEIVDRSSQGDYVERWKIWKNGLKKDERKFVASLQDSLSSLIPGVSLLLKSPEEMRRLARAAEASGLSRRHPAESVENIVADYLLPEENGGHAAVVLLWPAPSRLVLEARAWHEATHLRQALAFGGDWVHRHLLNAEMWAYGAETQHRLGCGDLSLYLEIMGYSPFGFGLALRNFTEHMTLRANVSVG